MKVLLTTAALSAYRASPPPRDPARSFWSRHACLSCCLITAVWFGATLGLRPLAIPDEGRYVGIAWELLRSSQWSVPTLDGMPFFHKPPLFYWITAASLKVFGHNAAAARLAPWLAAVVTTTGLFAFVERWVGTARAVAAVSVLGTLPLFYAGAQYANLDMLVASLVTSTVLLFAHAAMAREDGRGHRRALALGFGMAALGVLAKGLIGIVLPCLVILGWGVVTQRAGKVLALCLWAPGWLIFLAVSAPWFIVMMDRFPGFLHYFFVVQHLERFTGSGFNNLQPVWFYPAALMLLSLPWSGWLLTRLQWQRPQNLLGTCDGRPRDLRTLMLVWVALVTLFFSIPSSKPVGYILPAVPPLAVLLAEMVGTSPARWRQRWTVGAAVFCPLLAISAHFWQPKSLEPLGLYLKANRRAGEPVIDLAAYDYDVPFYAELDAPMIVVDPWSASNLAKDSWRHELKDAERFVGASSPHHLLTPDRLHDLLCSSVGTWLIAAWPPSGGSQWLDALTPAYKTGEHALWFVSSGSPRIHALLGCAAPQASSVNRLP